METTLLLEKVDLGMVFRNSAKDVIGFLVNVGTKTYVIDLTTKTVQPLIEMDEPSSD